MRLNKDLNNEDLLIIFSNFYEKKLKNEDIKELVMLWRKKAETARELVELANIINSRQGQKEIFHDTVDICGTGGDKSNTFNISTLAAIVASSCGAKVIKHSGRSTTSILGSVDVLNLLGYDIDNTDEIKEECFKKTNLMFVSSRLLRETFGDVKNICKKLNLPGFVNLIGPLSNPYKTNYHLLGVSQIKWGDLFSDVFKSQGNTKEALIVCCKVSSDVYLDEFAFCGENYVWHYSCGEVKKQIIRSRDFSVKEASPNDLKIKDIDESKAVFEAILKGNLSNSPKSQIVALNAGAVLYLTKIVKSIEAGYDFALRHIQSGKGWEHLQNFMNCNKKE